MKSAGVYSACAGIACAVAPPARAAGGSEAVFRNAPRYTVQVRVTLPVPFDGDRKGSAAGAGVLVDAGRGMDHDPCPRRGTLAVAIKFACRSCCCRTALDRYRFLGWSFI